VPKRLGQQGRDRLSERSVRMERENEAPFRFTHSHLIRADRCGERSLPTAALWAPQARKPPGIRFSHRKSTLPASWR
jgi:hypothetical protein